MTGETKRIDYFVVALAIALLTWGVSVYDRHVCADISACRIDK